MNTVTCPNCKHRLDLVSVEPAIEQKPLKYESLIRDVDGQISDRIVRAVLAFVRDIGPGRWAASTIYERYCAWRVENEAPSLRQASFGRAMQLVGTERFRTSRERGYIIPENIGTLEPVIPYINSRRASNAAMQRAVKKSIEEADQVARVVATIPDPLAPHLDITGKRLTPGGWINRDADLSKLPLAIE